MNQLPGNNYIAPQAWRTRVPEELYPTAYVAERTIKFLENYSRTDRSKPFYIQCSFPDPHHPFTPPGRYWDMYDPNTMSLPPSFNSGERPIPPHLQDLYDERAQNKSNRDGQRTFAITEREAREAVALTYGMITMVDDAIGSILGWLKSSGSMKIPLSYSPAITVTSWAIINFFSKARCITAAWCACRLSGAIPMSNRQGWSIGVFAAPSTSPKRS